MSADFFAQGCLSWLCCLQPLACLALGIAIGKLGGVLSALGFMWRSLTTRKE